MPRRRVHHHVFTPDPDCGVVLPWHLVGVPGGDVAERRLLLAILEDATTCLAGDERTAAEARAWFASDDLDWPFSFASVCWHLGLDHRWIRQGLAKRDWQLGRSVHRSTPHHRRRTHGTGGRRASVAACQEGATQ